MDDPTITILRLIADNWDESLVPYDTQRGTVFHTGAFDRDGDIPVVTFQDRDESPFASGRTGYSGTDGTSGLGMQTVGGALNVDCVAGTRSHLEGSGPNGGDLNPKLVRHRMKDQAIDIVLANQQATPFRSLSVTGDTDREYRDGGPTVYYTQLRCAYTYARSPGSQ